MRPHVLTTSSMAAVANNRSSGANDLRLPDNFVTDELHLEIMKLLYGQVNETSEDCAKYNDPLYIKKLRARALDGIKAIMSKVSYNALKTQGHTIAFSLPESFQDITFLSERSADDFQLYEKVKVKADAVSVEDINAKEYAAITGVSYLFERFSLFGVDSTHLQQLVDNLARIDHFINGNVSSQQELKKIVGALQSESLQVIQIKEEHNRFVILIRNHKRGLSLQIGLMMAGLALLIAAIATPQIRAIETVFGIMIAGGTALLVDGVSNTINMFMNTSREDYMVNQKLHKDALAELFDHVFNLGQSLDWEIHTTSLLSNGVLRFSAPQPPQNTLPLVTKPAGSARALTFSYQNLSGQHTNSDTTSQRNEPAGERLRQFSPARGAMSQV